MMRSSTLIMALFALFGYVAARPEMNCYMAHQSANIAFSHREQFELTLNANNGLQREYLCYCVDQSTTCERLDCRWVRKEEEGGGGASSSRDDEIKIITISDEEEEEEVEHVPIVAGNGGHSNNGGGYISIPSNEQGCYDSHRGSYVRRGISYVRPSTTGGPSKGCKCPLDGDAVLQCTDLQCSKMAPTPHGVLPVDMDFRDCFDPWTNREIRNGQRYNRTRLMSEYQSETGVYECSCTFGTARCTAVDIPCCDKITHEWKPKGAKVQISYQGTPMTCTCFGGRSAYRNCGFVRSHVNRVSHRTPSRTPSRVIPVGGTSIHLGNPVRVTPAPVAIRRSRPSLIVDSVPLSGTSSSSSSHSGGERNYCVDRYSQRHYNLNDNWTQNRGRRTYDCTCARSNVTPFLKTVCRIAGQQ